MLTHKGLRGRTVAMRTGLLDPASVPFESSLDMRARAGEAAVLLKALANPSRLRLLCQLAGGERNVSDLGVSAGIGQPSLSQQLGVLRGERLVATRREGKQVIYRIASPAALTVLKALYGLFRDPADASPSALTIRAPRRSPGSTATGARKRIA